MPLLVAVWRLLRDLLDAPNPPAWSLTRRVLTVVGVGLVWAALGLVPVPGSPIYPDGRRLWSLMTLGPMAVLECTLLVELVALTVPRWRRLRTLDGAGRATLLRATCAATLIGYAAQCLGLWYWLRSVEALGTADDFWLGWHPFVALACLFAGAVLQLGLAKLVSAAGFGSGLVLLLVVSQLLPSGVRHGGWAGILAAWRTIPGVDHAPARCPCRC